MFQSALKYGPSILNYGTKAAYIASQLGRFFTRSSNKAFSAGYTGGYGKSYGGGPYIKRRMAYYPTRAMYGSARSHGPLPYRSAGQYPMLTLARTGGNLGWQSEKKWIDIDDITTGGYIAPLWNYLDAVIPTTWQMANCPVIIQQGTSANGRIGNRVLIKEIMVRGILSLPSQTNVTNMRDTVDIALIEDTQCNGAQPNATDIFYRDIRDSFLNLNNNNRFKILYRKTFMFNTDGIVPTGAAYSSSPLRVLVDINVRCNIPITYSNTTGALSERRTNNIYLAQCSQEGLVGWLVGGTYETPRLRTRYIDMMN